MWLLFSYGFKFQEYLNLTRMATNKKGDSEKTEKDLSSWWFFIPIEKCARQNGFIFPNFPGWKLTIIELNPRPSCYCCPSFKIYKSLCFPDLLPHKGSGAIMGCHEICRDLKFSSLVEVVQENNGWQRAVIGTLLVSIFLVSPWKNSWHVEYVHFWGLESLLLQITIIMITGASPIEGLAIGPSFSCLRKAGSWENWVPTQIAWRVWRRFTYPEAPEELPNPNRKGLSSNFQSTIFQGLCLLNFGGVPVPFQTWT